jgi:hypothetical protein
MLDLSFDLRSLRQQVIDISPRLNGYGSEHYRYVTPEGKLAYLLVLAAGGEIDIDEDVFACVEIDVLPILLRDAVHAENIRGLIDFIREEHRCELKFTMDYQHASSIYMSEHAINLGELLRDRAKLRRLLFSSKSWIDTRHGEDLFHFDRNIESDIGDIFASAHSYVHRSLPQRFELAFSGENVTYTDAVGENLTGSTTPLSAWEDATNTFIFLRSETANAHIVDFQVGPDNEPRIDLEPENECPFADSFHNLLHYLYLRNENEQVQGYGFKLTVEPGIKAHVRGRRQIKDFWPHFAAETGIRVTVVCDDDTRKDVRRYFERVINVAA